jgi:hypothetical protein
MVWREFVAAAKRLHGNDWRAKVGAELYGLFGITDRTISCWEEHRETIPLHVELALRRLTPWAAVFNATQPWFAISCPSVRNALLRVPCGSSCRCSLPHPRLDQRTAPRFYAQMLLYRFRDL